MNKLQLVEAIALESGLTKNEASKALSAFTETLIKTVDSGVKVTVPGLGSFEKVIRAARMGINPSTKEKIQIAEKSAPKFKAAKSFKDRIA